MEQKSNILRLAVAACFGIAAGQAGAVVTIGTPAVFASENPSNASLQNTSSIASIAVDAIPGLKATGTTPFYLKVNLLNGATFAGVPGLTCAGTGVAGSAGITMTGQVTLGGNLASSVTFKISGQDGAGDSAYFTTGCAVSGVAYAISGVTNKTVSAQVEYTNGASVATTAQAGAWISFARGLSTVVSAPSVAATVDATSGSDNWAVGGNLTTVGTAYLGHITYGTNGNSALDSGGVSNITAGLVLTGATLTVAGPAVAAMMAIGTSGMYLATSSACSDTTHAAVFTTSASTTSVTFTGMTAGIVSGLGAFICGRVPGTTTITTGQLTATLGSAVAVATTITLDVSATSNNITNVTANGSTRNAYFVNASTSTAKTSVLRIINRSGIAGAITATAYDEAGTRLGTANASLGTLALNQMLGLTSAQLETAIGFTPSSPTAKYSVVLSGALPSFEVLNYTRDIATGAIVLSNTSTTNTQ